MSFLFESIVFHCECNSSGLREGALVGVQGYTAPPNFKKCTQRSPGHPFILTLDRALHSRFTSNFKSEDYIDLSRYSQKKFENCRSLVSRDHNNQSK